MRRKVCGLALGYNPPLFPVQIQADVGEGHINIITAKEVRS
jgi:hypothetical protein